MAVQQNKKSPSKRGMHRAHSALTSPPLAVEPVTGEAHLRHHISPNGYLPRQAGRQDQGRANRSARQAVAMPVTVAVDAMGGDHGPSVTLAAALTFLERTPDARVIAVGQDAPAQGGARAAALAGRSTGSPCMRRAKWSTCTSLPRLALREEEGLVDARRDQPRQGRHRAGLRVGRATPAR